MRDPYSVLGLAKSASEADVKSAFRKLAKRYHPDTNRDDPKAQAKFAEVNTAYEILSDKTKRAQFDRGEIDGEGKPKFAGFGGGNPFGGGRRTGPQGESTFESFSFGPEGMKRPSGGGAGGFDDILESILGGGFARRAHKRPPQFEEAGEESVGAVSVTLEEVMKGTTKRLALSNGREVDVKIPRGVANGQQIRLKGGVFGAGGILVTVTYVPHPLYRVEGSDLRRDLPVTLYEALLGAKIRVETLDGPVDLTLPPNTQGGKMFRLRGKGLPKKDATSGDLYIIISLVMPDRADPAFEALMRKWRDESPYSPRS